MGAYVRWALEHTFGVDTRFVGKNPSLPTSLAFATMEDPGEPVIVFYRQPNAPDMTIAKSHTGDFRQGVALNAAIQE